MSVRDKQHYPQPTAEAARQCEAFNRMNRVGTLVRFRPIGRPAIVGPTTCPAGLIDGNTPAVRLAGWPSWAALDQVEVLEVLATLPVGQRVEIAGGHWGTVVDTSVIWSGSVAVRMDDLARLRTAQLPFVAYGPGGRVWVRYGRLILPLE